MFNLVITEACPKGCTFCFTSTLARASDREMSVDTVNTILDNFSGDFSDVTVLGGEPTQHSKFQDVIKTIADRGIHSNLVSNFLFNDDILDYIVANIQHFKWMLPNASELDRGDRMSIWKKNYERIYDAYSTSWGFEESPRLYLSFTIGEDYEGMYDYIKWVLSQLPYKIKAVRIGLDLNGTYLVNNKQMGTELSRIMDMLSTNDIFVKDDCQIPPCLWEGDTESSVQFNARGLATFKQAGDVSCGNAPIDVFSDLSSIRCYPMQDRTNIKNVLEFDSVVKIVDTYETLYEGQRSEVPQDCKLCVFYPNQCNGICEGCL